MRCDVASRNATLISTRHRICSKLSTFFESPLRALDTSFIILEYRHVLKSVVVAELMSTGGSTKHDTIYAKIMRNCGEQTVTVSNSNR